MYFNLENCREFIRSSSIKSTISLYIHINSINLSIVETKYDATFIEEGFKMTPNVFDSLKLKYISRLYKGAIEEPDLGEKPILFL